MVDDASGSLEDVVRPMSAPTESDLRRAYCGKTVFVTGHSGFKGGWLTLWLESLGAKVFGYALAPEVGESFFAATDVASSCRHREADIRDRERLQQALAETRPDFVFHLAAQSLVRKSYEDPIATIETNMMGTANLLESIRRERIACSVVVVTSDKCYENREWLFGYRENEPMGGHDVYSMSKGATELLVASYRRSFFPAERLADHGVVLATARAGNVIGGGDWSKDRIVPDAIAALRKNLPIPVRNPESVRPWQHVLEPLGGYLLLGDRIAHGRADARAGWGEAWNFGPRIDDACTVRDLVEGLIDSWGSGRWENRHIADAPHEAGLLRLCIDKAHARLGWSPRWDAAEAIKRTVAWYRAHDRGADAKALGALCHQQIRDYMGVKHDDA